MKLHYSPTSPYTRKVTVSAHELGLHDRIERLATTAAGPNDSLHGVNPLGKVPALITEDGEVLFDSPVICEYLDALAGGGKLFPSAGKARWRALTFQALGDGIMDAVVLRMLERMSRGEGERVERFDDFQLGKIKRSLAHLEAKADELEGPVTIGTITVACMLGYLDFRLSEYAWRDEHSKLATWFEKMAARPSIRQTVPKVPS